MAPIIWRRVFDFIFGFIGGLYFGGKQFDMHVFEPDSDVCL
jgi:hypothetical protein